MTNLDPSDSLSKRWHGMEGKQMILLSVLIGMIAGLGGGVGGSMFRVDPFTGTEGGVLEQRIMALENEHREFKTELAQLPPDWFEQDFNEVKLELREVHKTGEALKLELIKITHMLGALQMRGHWSPNDLVNPGMFRTPKDKHGQ